MTRPTLGAPPAAKLLIPKGSLAAVLRPGVSRGATGAEKGLVVEGGELIGLPATLLGSRGARVGGGARRAGTGAGAWIKELNEEILGFFLWMLPTWCTASAGFITGPAWRAAEPLGLKSSEVSEESPELPWSKARGSKSSSFRSSRVTVSSPVWAVIESKLMSLLLSGAALEVGWSASPPAGLARSPSSLPPCSSTSWSPSPPLLSPTTARSLRLCFSRNSASFAGVRRAPTSPSRCLSSQFSRSSLAIFSLSDSAALPERKRLYARSNAWPMVSVISSA